MLQVNCTYLEREVYKLSSCKLAIAKIKEREH